MTGAAVPCGHAKNSLTGRLKFTERAAATKRARPTSELYPASSSRKSAAGRSPKPVPAGEPAHWCGSGPVALHEAGSISPAPQLRRGKSFRLAPSEGERRSQAVKLRDK